MKVYAICPECDDPYYGYAEPMHIESSYEKAMNHLKSMYKKVEEKKSESMPLRTYVNCDDYDNYLIVEHEML